MAKLTIEIADTPTTLAQGLMHRQTLDADAGMLFKFQNPIEAQFWGKNTYIPLDIAFVNNDRIIDIRHIAPMSTRMIHSNGFCNMAIEANAGYFAKHGIEPGYQISINNRTVEFKC